ncbi:MAG: SDR family oxidoreductase [Microbacterium sp.]
MSTGRVVLVTGGNRGIGRAIAERFVAEGYRTAVTARSGEGPEGTLTVRADVTDAASLDAAFTEVEREWGSVEIVVANAGITKDTLLLRMTEDDFDSVVATNLGGTFRVVKRASKGMLRAGPRHPHLERHGPVRLRGSDQLFVVEGRIIGFARSLTRELGGRGITADVGNPGIHRDRHDGGASRRLQASTSAAAHAGRFATPDIAGVVAWLASDDAHVRRVPSFPSTAASAWGSTDPHAGASRRLTAAVTIASASRSGCENCSQ